MLRRFLLRISLFLLPLILCGGLPLLLTYHVGDLLSVDQIVQEQVNDSAITYNPDDRGLRLTYKLRGIELRQPEVAILGSSRILQFRDFFFNKAPDQFYNAGGHGWELDEAYTMLQNIDPASQPKIILLGIDYLWFNDDFEDVPLAADWYKPAPNYRETLSLTNRVLTSLLRGQIGLETLLARQSPNQTGRAIGFTAITGGTAYRSDGSLQLGANFQNLQTRENLRLRDSDSAAAGLYAYQSGDTISQESLDLLEAFLIEAKARGIHVVGIAPPFTGRIYSIMRNRGQHAYLFAAAEQLPGLFAGYGFDFFDFSDPRLFGGSDEEMYDGWHATELLSARMMIEMIKARPSVFAEYSDVAFLEDLISRSADPISLENPLARTP